MPDRVKAKRLYFCPLALTPHHVIGIGIGFISLRINEDMLTKTSLQTLLLESLSELFGQGNPVPLPSGGPFFRE